MAERRGVKLTNDLIRTVIAGLGMPKPELGLLHVMGVRSAAPREKTLLVEQINRPNYYDDTILLFGSALSLFRATVDPGSTYTKKPLNPGGAAHLINGAYRYKLGLHKGRSALVQAGPVRIWRDADRDHERDANEKAEEVGYFGINIHAGSGQIVGAASAGCQVIGGGWSGEPWQRFMRFISDSRQTSFRYYLVDGSAFWGLEG